MAARSFSSSMRAFARAAAQAERARQRDQKQQEVTARRMLRDAERNTRLAAKEAARDYLSAQIEEAEARTREIREQELMMETLLAHSLTLDPTKNTFSNQKISHGIKTFAASAFDELRWPAVEPRKVIPKPLGFFAKLIPGASKRHAEDIENAERRYKGALAHYQETRRKRDLDFAEFGKLEEKRKENIENKNKDFVEFQKNLQNGEKNAVIEYYEAIIKSNLNKEVDALGVALGYSAQSKHLVVDLELPELSIIPNEIGFKYVKSTNSIDPIIRAAGKRKNLYLNLICQISLKCIDIVFRGRPSKEIVECLTLNGMLDTVDPATGQNVRVCLLSVRITPDTFEAINLSQVQPEQCLRSLKASVSRAPAELLPVKPLVELDMVDPRFIESEDIISILDQRPNLMDLRADPQRN